MIWRYKLNLKPYTNHDENECSLYKNVPIALREQVLAHFRARGIKIRLKYRGPRSQARRHQRQSTCLLRDANRFSVYFDFLL